MLRELNRRRSYLQEADDSANRGWDLPILSQKAIPNSYERNINDKKK